MSSRTGPWFAWSVWALIVPTSILTLFFASFNEPSSSLWDEVLLPVLILAFSTVGALVASYRPENTIGWLFLSGAFVWIVGELTLEYGVYALITIRARCLQGYGPRGSALGRAGSDGSFSFRSCSCCFLRGGCPPRVGVRSCGGLRAPSCFSRWRLGVPYRR